jgi:membrane-associated phospholipid phosphatase
LLGLLGLSVAAFAKLAEEVTSREWVVTFDGTVATWLHEHAGGFPTTLLRLATELGSPVAILALSVGTVAALLLRRSRLQAAFTGVAVAGGEGLNLLLKAAFERPRPSFSDPLATAGGFAFPSGHAMISLVVYGGIGTLISARLVSRRRRGLLLGGLALVVLAVGFSRVYLGVHYVSDVLAGYSAGLAWLAACGLAFHSSRSWRRRASILVLAALLSLLARRGAKIAFSRRVSGL